MYMHYKHVYVIVKVWRSVNPRIYLSKVVKVYKILLNTFIFDFYQMIFLNVGIYQHLLIKVRKEW